MEKLRLEFVKNRKMKDERKKSQVKLSEATEYGLDKQEDLVSLERDPFILKIKKWELTIQEGAQVHHPLEEAVLLIEDKFFSTSLGSTTT